MAQSISCGGVSVLVKSWRRSVKICRYRRLYLCLPFNNLSKLVHKSSSQKAVKIVQRAVYSKKFASCCLPDATCSSPKYDVGLSLWPVSLKVFGCYSNLKENVSNNFKYSYLIYWAFMFLPQMGCYGLRRNLWRDYIYMHFLSNLNHDKKLVSEIDWLLLSVHHFFKSMYLFGSALNVVHNMLTIITYLI